MSKVNITTKKGTKEKSDLKHIDPQNGKNPRFLSPRCEKQRNNDTTPNSSSSTSSTQNPNTHPEIHHQTDITLSTQSKRDPQIRPSLAPKLHAVLCNGRSESIRRIGGPIVSKKPFRSKGSNFMSYTVTLAPSPGDSTHLDRSS